MGVRARRGLRLSRVEPRACQSSPPSSSICPWTSAVLLSPKWRRLETNGAAEIDSLGSTVIDYGAIRTSAASRLPAKVVLPAGVITAAPGSETEPAASLNEPDGVAVTPFAIDVFAGALKNE